MTCKTAKVVRLDSTLDHGVCRLVTSRAGEPEHLMLLVDEAEVASFTPDVVGESAIMNSTVAIRTHLPMACSTRRGGRGHAGAHMTH